MNDWLQRVAPQYRIAQGLAIGAPIAAKSFGNHSVVWPPLGSLDPYSVGLATVVIGLCSIVPLLIPTKQKAMLWLRHTIAGTIMLFVCCAALIAKYVIVVETPVDGEQVRSVGFCVNPQIRTMYPYKNDTELLKIGGLEEWQIQTVWTPNSVLALRLLLLLSFAFTLGTANIALGLAARLQRRT